MLLQGQENYLQIFFFHLNVNAEEFPVPNSQQAGEKKIHNAQA